MSLPTITIAGNVQRIEKRQTQGGKNITAVSISCGEKNSKGEYDNLYIKADFWEAKSDFVSKFFKEGDAIMVTGKLVTGSYEKADGTKVYETKFLFPNADFVPRSRGTQPHEQPTQPQQQQRQQAQRPQAQPEFELEIDNNGAIPF